MLLMRFPVHVKHQTGDMGRRVVLDMAICQRGRLRADKQPLRRIIGTVGATRDTIDKDSGLKRWFYHLAPRLLAVQEGCLM